MRKRAFQETSCPFLVVAQHLHNTLNHKISLFSRLNQDLLEVLSPRCPLMKAAEKNSQPARKAHAITRRNQLAMPLSLGTELMRLLINLKSFPRQTLCQFRLRTISSYRLCHFAPAATLILLYGYVPGRLFGYLLHRSHTIPPLSVGLLSEKNLGHFVSSTRVAWGKKHRAAEI